MPDCLAPGSTRSERAQAMPFWCFHSPAVLAVCVCVCPPLPNAEVEHLTDAESAGGTGVGGSLLANGNEGERAGRMAMSSQCLDSAREMLRPQPEKTGEGADFGEGRKQTKHSASP